MRNFLLPAIGNLTNAKKLKGKIINYCINLAFKVY